MGSILLSLHQIDAYMGIAIMLVAAIYGFVSHRRDPRHISAGYKRLLILGGSVLLIQVIIGLTMLATGLRPSEILHIAIYGALSPLVIPATYLYTRGRGRNHPNLAFGLVTLFLMGFLIRGTYTG
ncbi:MAG: hypothetical protein BZY82_04870 [SAR202 cluster bacterium Io17-Chloro-G3]|nr:MAG: hypothetical protein BZY82_04870 [SAR202 cluster bacterium Io17-Chloro-G3]